MIKLILKISPLVLLLVLQGCSDEYCCNIPGTDAIPASCSDGISTDEATCTAGSCSYEWYTNQEECEWWGYTWTEEGTWNEGIPAVVGTNECYSDQEECENNCANHNVDETLGGGNCREGKE